MYKNIGERKMFGKFVKIWRHPYSDLLPLPRHALPPPPLTSDNLSLSQSVCAGPEPRLFHSLPTDINLILYSRLHFRAFEFICSDFISYSKRLVICGLSVTLLSLIMLNGNEFLSDSAGTEGRLDIIVERA